MAKTNSVGLTQLSNGNWSCRVHMKNPYTGKVINTAYRRDENNQPFKTRKQASDFRARMIVKINNPTVSESKPEDKTIGDLWQVYLNGKAKEKAKATVVRYTSLWNNHIKAKFENVKVNELTTAQIEDFLRDLYHSGLSYAYVEGFTKFFWLVLGIAVDNNWIDYDKYLMMTQNPGTKIHMPPKVEDDEEEDNPVEIFELNEIEQLDNYFKDSNLYTAFLMGYYLGLRISECFGTMWTDINWREKTIRINKQLVYEDGCFCIKNPKTKAGTRTVDIPDVLLSHLKAKIRKARYTAAGLGAAYRNTEVCLDKRKLGEPTSIVGGDFINRKPNGELLTNNSFKYHAKRIKETLGINFKYHSLRRTHITQLAAMITPVIEVMRRVGHTKYDTTMRFYVSVNEETKQRLIGNINKITMVEPIVEITLNDGTIKKMKQSEYERFKKITAMIPC